MPLSSRPGIVQIARLLGAAAEQDGVVMFGERLDGNVDADMRVGEEGDAFGAHLLECGDR